MSEKYAADRVKAIVLLRTKWTLEEVSEALLLDTETLRSYISLYKTGGAKKLIERHYKGDLSKLSDQELKALKTHLTGVTYLIVSEIIAYVKKTYGKPYAISGMIPLLHQLGFSYKKSAMAPCKVDTEKQLKFLQEYEKIRRSGKPVYLMEGCHPQHNSMPQ